jgi:hypothetical protein
MKVRSPKSEIRRKSEDRNPNIGTGSSGTNPQPDTVFRLRISVFPRVSDFGLRILLFTLTLVAAQPIYAIVWKRPAADDIPRLRPPQAEIPPTFWEQHSLSVVILVVLGLAVIGLVIWMLVRPKPPVIVPPEVVARRALEPLRQQPENGLLLSQVSQILRRYVTAAFHLPPGELTTADFIRAITEQGKAGPELSGALREFLRQCDQRKFSPPAPAPPLCAATHALKLIDQAQARLAALAQPVAQLGGSRTTSPPTTGSMK